MKRVLLGATGSIGIVSVPSFILWMRDELAVDVTVMMSSSALQFVSAMTMRALSGNDVACGLFDESSGLPVPHVQLVADASLLVILPATANVIGKSAAGIADDLITTTILSATCPIMFVPAMSNAMWSNKLVQRNVRTLRDVGHDVMEPSRGLEVATMKREVGALPAFKDVTERVRHLLSSQPDCHSA